MKITVLLADDHELVRAGLRSLLESDGDIQVVAEAGTGEEAIQLAQEHRPQVVLMDVEMPGIGGIEATRKLVRWLPETKVIALTLHASEPFPAQLLGAGAAGYLTKGSSTEETKAAIRSVMGGGRYIAHDVAQQMVMNQMDGRGASNNPFEQLSAREMQVALMVAQGQSIQDISDSLNLSPKTVSTYRYRIFEKLDVKNDVELTRLAVKHDIVSVETG